MTDEDYELLSRWSRERMGVYSSSGPEFVDGRELKESARRAGLHYLMAVAHDGQRVGGVSWSQVSHAGSYEVGLGIGDAERWTLGYGMDAAAILLRYLFHVRNARRVQAIIGDYNRNMLQFVAKGFMTVEGVLRDYFFLDGEYHDAVICSILRDEYYAMSVPGLPEEDIDVISAQEKAQAKRVLTDCLARSGDSYLTSLVNRARRSS
ncbi:GNAT family N-acetyltransferase [Streptoalloteichus tenebrarius]|nr:GNAT family protein [Streptoalloteichus tenebrarius]